MILIETSITILEANVKVLSSKRKQRFSPLQIARRSFAYEGAGKTTVTVLNKDAEYGLLIDTYSEVGFRLNNGMSVVGPMVIFPFTVLSWNVGGVEDITEDSLSLFTLLEPKIDILIIGVGDKLLERQRMGEILRIMKKLKTHCEVLSTDHACSTFNFLNAENRYVAAALIPPKEIKSEDHGIDQRRLRESLYKPD